MAHPDLTQRIAEIKTRIQQVSPDDVVNIIENLDRKIVILDVREDSEYETGHLATAINLPYIEIEEKINHIITDKSATIVSYCQSGNRSALATDTLNKLGYENAVSLAGGITAWKTEGKAVINKDFSPNTSH
ncbi:rhodanese-like domain-containing protein [Geminocystis sp. CENA526]|uniref:rhodanese-like domain-containing protein n=1 Tax=Geminocystis sp. CENA526 TaxID=1355871 RepID=UPI003D6EAF66